MAHDNFGNTGNRKPGDGPVPVPVKETPKPGQPPRKPERSADNTGKAAPLD